MNDYFGWFEVGGSDLLFNPEDDVVTCPVRIVPQIVIEAQMGNSTSLQQLDDFFWPATSVPSNRDWSFIVKVDLQF
jgi:hypothetical protein